MQRLEVSGAVRPIYGSLGVKRLITSTTLYREVLQKFPMYKYILVYKISDCSYVRIIRTGTKGYIRKHRINLTVCEILYSDDGDYEK